MEKSPKQLSLRCDKVTFQYLNKKFEGEPVSFTGGRDNFSPLFWIIAQTAKYNTFGNDIIKGQSQKGKALRTNKLEADKTILVYEYPLNNDHRHHRRKVNLLNTMESLMFGILVKHQLMLELARFLDESDDFNKDYKSFLSSYQLDPVDLPKDKAFKFYLRYRRGEVPQMSLVRREDIHRQELIAC